MVMEEWLRQRLIASGILRADGVTRRLSYGKCKLCREWVLRALDGDVCAVAVVLEPYEADRAEEFVAIFQGRRTFEVCMLNRPGKFAYCIEPRRPYHITKETKHPVVVEHRCGDHITHRQLRMVREEPPDEPPF